MKRPSAAIKRRPTLVLKRPTMERPVDCQSMSSSDEAEADVVDCQTISSSDEGAACLVDERATAHQSISRAMANPNCPNCKVHQIFFNFDGKTLLETPIFAKSLAAFGQMQGWDHKLWNESDVDALIRKDYPEYLQLYRDLPHAIQKVDVAKYAILNSCGGLYADLDVLPKYPLTEIIGNCDFLFDRDSRKGVVANDVIYVKNPNSLVGVMDSLKQNLLRVNGIKVYAKWKMRYIGQSTGPDFWTRFIKESNLLSHQRALANRIFSEGQSHRNLYVDGACFDIFHQLSWAHML